MEHESPVLYLLNPSGSVVEIGDQDEYQRLLTKGFTLPSPGQIGEYQRLRDAQFRVSHPEPANESQVYYASVSPARNGYGIASDFLLQEFANVGIKFSQAQAGQKIGFLFHAPYSITRLDNPVKIIYTMFESDKIPPEWTEYLDAADLIIVPSHFCMEVFAKAGYSARVVPLGFNQKDFTYVERPIKHDTHENFYFLHYDAFNIRKGFLELFKAFLKAFDPSEPVKMIFKTTKDQIPLPMPPSEYPNIKIITGGVTDQELAAMCHKADAFVFPSRGEGFGMTPLEAMGTGLPTIVPNAHGISEYFNEEFMYGVKVAKRSPAAYKRYKDQDVGNMIEVDIDDLAAKMRYVYEHEKEAKEKGKKAAEYVKQFSFHNTALQLKAIFDEYLAKDFPVKPIANILPLEQK